MQDSQPFFVRFLTALLFFFAAYYFLSIDLLGDPSIFKRWGDFGDEGYWLNGAKNFLYSGSISNGIDQLNQAEIGAPLYTLILYLSFILFDDSLLTARSVSIFFTSLVVFIICLTNFISLKNKFIFAILFITSSTVISYGQWATPQSIQIFFEFLAILLLCTPLKNDGNYASFFSGASAALVISTKLSGYIFVGCYFAVLILIWMISKNIKPFIFALAGFVIFLTPLVIYLLLNLTELQIFLAGLGAHGSLIYDNFPFIEFRPLFFLVYSYDTALKMILFLGICSGAFLLFSIKNKLKLDNLGPKDHIYFLFPAIMILLYCFLTITADISDRRVYSFIIPAIMSFILLLSFIESKIEEQYSKKLFLLNVLGIFLMLLNIYQFSIIQSNRTFSHNALSVKLNTILKKYDCVTGVTSHWFIADTLATPIWHRKDIGYKAFNPKTPFMESKKCKRNFIITGLFEGEYIDAELSITEMQESGLQLKAVQKILIPSSGRLTVARFDGKIFELLDSDL